MIHAEPEKEGFAAFLLRMRSRGIIDRSLVSAFELTPRAAFIPGQWRSAVWSNRMVPIECGETLEGIDLQAIVLAALSLDAGNRVLEIGSGSGYTAAVMARLVARVYTLERYRTLTELARQRFEALGIENAIARHADGSGGLPADGPFDRIVSWVAFESLPRSFTEQLSSGGIMIVPIGPDEGEQTLAQLTKVGSRFEREDIGRVRLQPVARSIAKAL